MQAQNAQKPFDIDLWQQGMPNTNGMDSAPFDESKGNFKPSIRVFLPAPELATGRVVTHILLIIMKVMIGHHFLINKELLWLY